MKKEKWQVEADNWAMEEFDYILDTYYCNDFVEFVGKTGGDTHTYRYYSDGKIYER